MQNEILSNQECADMLSKAGKSYYCRFHINCGDLIINILMVCHLSIAQPKWVLRPRPVHLIDHRY